MKEKSGMKSSQDNMENQTEPARAWVTLVSVILAQSLCEYIYVTFPVLFPALRDKYDATQEEVGSVYMIIDIGYGIGAIAVTPLIGLFGCKRSAFVSVMMYVIGYLSSAFAPSLCIFKLTYATGAGLGCGALQTCTVTVIQQIFHKNRDRATALCFLGASFAQMYGPGFVEFTLREHGLRGSLMFQAGLQGQGLVLVSLFMDPQIQLSQDDDKDQPKSLRQHIDHLLGLSLLKDPLFLIYVCIRSLWTTVLNIVTLYSVSSARHYGIDYTQADTLPSFISVGGTVCGVIFIILSSKSYFSVHLYYLMGMLLLNVGSFLPLIKTYPAMVAAMLMVGINDGSTAPAAPLVILDIVGVESIAKGWALQELMTVLASYFGGPFGGWLADKTGSYTAVYLFAGGVATCCSVLSIIVVSVLMYRKSRRKCYDQIVEE